MKQSKTKITLKGLYEAPQDVITEQATLALFESQKPVETSTEPLNTIEAVLPRFNKHFKLDTLKVIEDALIKYPTKVDKIILYANTVDESQLPLIFSVPSF